MSNDILAEEIAMPRPTPGYRIRIMRKEKGLNQAELAAELAQRGVTVSGPMISLYESNQNRPVDATWDALADIFGVSLDWLRCRSEIRNPDQQLAALNFPEDVLALARKLAGFPNGVRRDVVSLADVIVNEIHDIVVLDRQEALARLREKAKTEGVEQWEAKHRIKITD